ncbi:MAG: HIT domain-containing protein [Alphaproteobacteria bacterium]|nr:HIT domain-containing protein [Alphaproteobacteria bacterium]
MYDKSNVFFKILSKEIPCDTVYEDDVCLAFKDINPQSKIHVLIISKGLYTDFTDFASSASSEVVYHFFKAIPQIASLLGISETGYRIASNIGKDANQVVPHFHMHLLGGEKLRDL